MNSIEIRSPKAAIDAHIVVLTKARDSPTQVLERLVEVERREREQRNLARHSRMAAVPAQTRPKPPMLMDAAAD